MAGVHICPQDTDIYDVYFSMVGVFPGDLYKAIPSSVAPLYREVVIGSLTAWAEMVLSRPRSESIDVMQTLSLDPQKEEVMRRSADVVGLSLEGSSGPGVLISFSSAIMKLLYLPPSPEYSAKICELVLLFTKEMVLLLGDTQRTEG